MKVSSYIEKLFAQKLIEARVLVRYEGEGCFADFITRLDIHNVNIVSAQESALAARRKAETVFRLIDNPSAPVPPQ